jgi:hypothetical protein
MGSTARGTYPEGLSDVTDELLADEVTVGAARWWNRALEPAALVRSPEQVVLLLVVLRSTRRKRRRPALSQPAASLLLSCRRCRD